MTTLPVTHQECMLTVRDHQIRARWLVPDGGAVGAVSGQDTPVLVFLHEALGSIGQWKDFPDRLCAATGLTGLVYERLGYGGSDPAPLPRTVDYLQREGEDWLPAVLEAAGVTRPPLLFGHSDGGSIALYYAARHRARALVTAAAHIFVEEITLEGIRAFTPLWEQTDVRQKLARYHGDKTEDVFRAWSETWQTPAFIDGFRMEAVLPEIDCPALILQGEDDQYGSAAQVEGIVAGIGPLARSVFLPGCGHSPHLEQKAETVAVAASFFHEVLRVPAQR